MPEPASAPLLTEFSPTTKQEWRSLVESELKGAPFDKKLVTRTPEGIDIQPLYAAEDSTDLSPARSLPGFPPYLRGSNPLGNTTGGWEICQELTHGNPRDFNHAALIGLERGMTAINFFLDKATRSGLDPDMAPIGDVGFGGLSVATLSDLARALESIHLDIAPLFVRTGSSALPFAALLIAYLRQHGKNPAILRGCIEMDPLGVLSHEGTLPHSLDAAYREMAHLTRWASQNAPQLQTICVHSRAFHESGASAVQELGCALAAGAEYLRAMLDRELPLATVAPHIRFSMSAGTRFFMEIAKFRAARTLWAQVVAAFGGGPNEQRMVLHARTSNYSMTVYDPYVNMLRATTEAFSGVVGGCDSMHVAPFDEIFRTPDDFSRRIARNTQVLLKEESYFHRVIDPAGGSYYVESLTDAVASKSWEWFQEIERHGGLAKALEEGFVQAEIKKTAAGRAKDVAGRRTILVGTNAYANPSEKTLEPRTPDYAAIHKTQSSRIQQYRVSQQNEQNTLILRRLAEILDSSPHNLVETCSSAALAGATLGEISRTIRSGDSTPPNIEPLKLHRAAEPFERLRGRASAFEAATGQKPLALLLCMGPLKQHKARADFCTGFLETAGFKIELSPRCEDANAAISAAQSSPAKVAVICSTDDTYPDLAPAIAQGIKAQKPGTTIVLAGYPQDHVEALKTGGIDSFIHIRANAVELLDQLLTQAGA